MSNSRNTLLAVVFALSTLAIAAQSTEACKGSRGGGFSRSYSSSHRSYNSNSAPRYSTPSYNTYSQPTYHSTHSQPVQVVRPVQTIAPQPVVQQQTPIQQVSQPQPVAAPQPQPQPVQQTAPKTTPNNDAAMSALQALGGFAPPQQTPAPQPQQVQTPVHVGNWTATLGNGATVQLNLAADGNFKWIATNKSGSSSSFSGSYTVSNGSLSLNRSNDNQQLAGSMTTNGNNAFSFTVAGNNAAAISFSRS